MRCVSRTTNHEQKTIRRMVFAFFILLLNSLTLTMKYLLAALLLCCLWVLPAGAAMLPDGQADSLRRELLFHTDDTVAIRTMRELAWYYTSRNSDSAMHYYNRALELSDAREDHYLRGRLYYGIGDLFFKNRNYKPALDYYFRFLAEVDRRAAGNADSVKLAGTYASLYSQLGLCYFNLGNTDNALIYFHKSLAKVEQFKPLNTEKDYLERKMAMMVNIGSVYLENKKFGESRNWYERALLINKKLNNVHYGSALYNNLGIISMEQKQYEQAFDYYARALAIRTTRRDTAGMAQVLNNLGKVYYVVKDYAKAEEVLRRSLALTAGTGNNRSEMFATQFLSLALEAGGRYREALDMHKQFKSLYDSIINNDAAADAVRMETEYKYEKLQRERELVQQLEIAKRERKAMIYLTIAGILLALFIIATLLIRNQRIRMKQAELSRKSLELESINLGLEKHNLELKNENLEMELTFKKKELATQVMYLLQKNELIANAIREIQLLKESPADKQNAALHHIITDMKASLDKGAWDEFEVRFQQVHQEFYDKLHSLHPDLTPNEVKLCAFLRLNMTTKDISAITYQTAKSIQVARTRLRRKLGMERDENLVSWLQQL